MIPECFVALFINIDSCSTENGDDPKLNDTCLKSDAHVGEQVSQVSVI